jgi:hypothetical protein
LYVCVDVELGQVQTQFASKEGVGVSRMTGGKVRADRRELGVRKVLDKWMGARGHVCVTMLVCGREYGNGI